jgi:hypothetical protein
LPLLLVMTRMRRPKRLDQFWLGARPEPAVSKSKKPRQVRGF